jgi:hypothetical protein
VAWASEVAAIHADTYFVVQYRKTMPSLTGARVSKEMIKEKVLRKIRREFAANYDMFKALLHLAGVIRRQPLFLGRCAHTAQQGAGASKRRPFMRRHHH